MKDRKRPETLFRLLLPGEIPVVHALWREAGLSFCSSGRDTVERMTKEIEAGSAFMVGAFEEGEMAGVILGTDDGRKGWINRLAVKPSHRGRGMGRQLIARCENVLKERGRGIICCLIEDWNASSLSLFRSEGYDLRKDIYYLRKVTGGDGW